MNTDKIKQRLEEYQASIVERREKLARHVHHRDEPLPQDFAEQAVEMENDETMRALEDELSEQARDVVHLVAKILLSNDSRRCRPHRCVLIARMQALNGTSTLGQLHRTHCGEKKNLARVV